MARTPKIEIYPKQGAYADGHPTGNIDHYIRVRAANGEIIATGAEGYDSKGNAKRAAKRLVATVEKAVIVEVGE